MVLLAKNVNSLLSESCRRSKRKKVQEAALRIEDHLRRFRSISELNCTISNDSSHELEAHDDCTTHS